MTQFTKSAPEEIRESGIKPDSLMLTVNGTPVHHLCQQDAVDVIKKARRPLTIGFSAPSLRPPKKKLDGFKGKAFHASFARTERLATEAVEAEKKRGIRLGMKGKALQASQERTERLVIEAAEAAEAEKKRGIRLGMKDKVLQASQERSEKLAAEAEAVEKSLGLRLALKGKAKQASAARSATLKAEAAAAEKSHRLRLGFKGIALQANQERMAKEKLIEEVAHAQSILKDNLLQLGAANRERAKIMKEKIEIKGKRAAAMKAEFLKKKQADKESGAVSAEEKMKMKIEEMEKKFQGGGIGFVCPSWSFRETQSLLVESTEVYLLLSAVKEKKCDGMESTWNGGGSELLKKQELIRAYGDGATSIFQDLPVEV